MRQNGAGRRGGGIRTAVRWLGKAGGHRVPECAPRSEADRSTSPPFLPPWNAVFRLPAAPPGWLRGAAVALPGWAHDWWIVGPAGGKAGFKGKLRGVLREFVWAISGASPSQGDGFLRVSPRAACPQGGSAAPGRPRQAGRTDAGPGRGSAVAFWRWGDPGGASAALTLGSPSRFLHPARAGRGRACAFVDTLFTKLGHRRR
jgi:hypothetical protein